MSKVHESAFKSVPKGREGSGGVWMARRFLDQRRPHRASSPGAPCFSLGLGLSQPMKYGPVQDETISLVYLLYLRRFLILFFCVGGGEDGCCFNPKVMFSCTSSTSNLKTQLTWLNKSYSFSIIVTYRSLSTASLFVHPRPGRCHTHTQAFYSTGAETVVKARLCLSNQICSEFSDRLRGPKPEFSDLGSGAYQRTMSPRGGTRFPLERSFWDAIFSPSSEESVEIKVTQGKDGLGGI